MSGGAACTSRHVRRLPKKSLELCRSEDPGHDPVCVTAVVSSTGGVAWLEVLLPPSVLACEQL